jgi:nucleotide sugar dehydrogenase
MPDQLTVVGVGLVGEAVCDLAHIRGLEVNGVEIEPHRRKQLSRKPYPVSGDYASVKGSRWAVLTVPTESAAGDALDVSALEAACTVMGPHLAPTTTVIVESTVPPRACDDVVIPSLRRWLPEPLVAHCPERIDAGRALPLSAIPRVLGASGPEALASACALYTRLLDSPPAVLGSIQAAAMAKLVENAFRSVNIALVNEVAVLCQNLGVDVNDVLRGAATKPFGFLPHTPGVGVGGPCIPVDLFDDMLNGGPEVQLLTLARRVNAAMPAFTADILEDAMAQLRLPQGPIAILGLAYKPNLADTRNSPGLRLVDELRARGCETLLYDPYCPGQSEAASLPEALRRCSIAVLCTAHDEFLGIEDELAAAGVRLVIDGRNVLDRERLEALGVAYRGVGRPAASTHTRFRLDTTHS